MSNTNSHIIVIDGATETEKKTLTLELALALLYNNLKTAILCPKDNVLEKLLNQRKQNNLPTPVVLNQADFLNNTDFDAIIIPKSNFNNDFTIYAHTYITILKNSSADIQKFKNNNTYINALWELKKSIASKHKRSLNWVVCENASTLANTHKPSAILKGLSRRYGFRLASPISLNICCHDTLNGISSQDKISFKQNLTYTDIYNQREITKLAEFIFNQ